MSARPKTIDVTIMGRAYKVACEESEREALLEAVTHLDRKMIEIRDTGKVSSTERIAVMAALNLAHEMLVARGGGAPVFDIDALKRRIGSMQATLDRALAAR